MKKIKTERGGKEGEREKEEGRRERDRKERKYLPLTDLWPPYIHVKMFTHKKTYTHTQRENIFITLGNLSVGTCQILTDDAFPNSWQHSQDTEQPKFPLIDKWVKRNVLWAGNTAKWQNICLAWIRP